jgi:hypothetical protein
LEGIWRAAPVGRAGRTGRAAPVGLACDQAGVEAPDDDPDDVEVPVDVDFEVDADVEVDADFESDEVDDPAVSVLVLDPVDDSDLRESVR